MKLYTGQVIIISIYEYEGTDTTIAELSFQNPFIYGITRRTELKYNIL
jgi:hypothetical protein